MPASHQHRTIVHMAKGQLTQGVDLSGFSLVTPDNPLKCLQEVWISLFLALHLKEHLQAFSTYG